MIDLPTHGTAEECLRAVDAWLSAPQRTRSDAIALANAVFAKTNKHVDIVNSGLGILTNEKGEVLLLRRSPMLRSFPDLLSFPGGKQEAEDADLSMTATREMEQETGLRTKATHLCGTRYTTEYQRKRIHAMEFWILVLDGIGQNIKLSDEHSGYVWAMPRTILDDPAGYPLAGQIILQDLLRSLI